MTAPSLVEFLTARLDADEAVARAAICPCGGPVCTVENGWIHRSEAEARLEGTGPVEFVLHFTPARVLADVKAKRAIVEAYEDERQRMDIYNRDYPLGKLTTEGDLRARLSSNARWAGLDIAVRALASAYSDHPDYPDATGAL